MKDLTVEVLSMSSLEIAELTGKEHADVLKAVDKLLIELEIDCREFSRQYKDKSGKSNRMFELDKDTTLCLVSGYNAKLRMAIIKRWQELEGPVKPMTMMEMVAKQALAMVEQERFNTETNDRVSAIEETVKRLDVPYDEEDFVTIHKYVNMTALKLNYAAKIKLGKACAKHSRTCNITIEKRPCRTHGTVNAYRKEVIAFIIEQA